MKSIALLLVSTITAIAVMAQTSIVTINVKGDRNKEVLIDGNAYIVNAHMTSTTRVNIPIRLTNLSTGQHTLRVRRSNQYNTQTSIGSTTTFTLRQGYDLTITVNNNGSIQLTERRAGRRNNNNYPDAYRTPMSDQSFSDLLRSIQYQRTNNARYVAINNAFNNSTNYFTSYQAHQLISLVNSQPNRLALAKTAYKTITDPAAYTSTMDDLIHSQANRRNLDAYVWNYDQTNRIPGTATREPMPDQNFNDLVRRISNRWGVGVKMSALTEEFNKTENYFTTMQARQLIQLVSDETNRLQLGKLAYDNVVDPQNFHQLYDVLASQSSRNELDAYVKANYSNSNSGYYPVQSPMTGESFTSLHNDISSRWGIGAKMTALTDVFANSSYYFTTAQARQLIQLVSSETNRLELAKSAYDNIVDPENFSQVYDLFTSQASRNELAAFVNAYSYNR